MKKVSRLFSFIVLLLLSGCSESSVDVFKKDAAAFCDVFDVEEWLDIYQKGEDSTFEGASNPTNSENEWFDGILRKRVNASVESIEFKNLTDHINSRKYFSEIYPSTKLKIEALTGEEWQCEKLEFFYRDLVANPSNINQPVQAKTEIDVEICLLYTSPSPRD